jgi:hypothetical protein
MSRRKVNPDYSSIHIVDVRRRNVFSFQLHWGFKRQRSEEVSSRLELRQ